MTIFGKMCTTGAAGLAAVILASGASAGNNCPADLNGDNVVDAADLGILLGSWGPCAGCPADLTGDGDVGAADLGILLGAWGPCPIDTLCPDSDHDCCTTGVPGCTDTECCETVCAADPFCCETAWDTLCVNGAVSLCGLECGSVCDNADHDCFTTGGPGCTDTECCELVCSIDPFCCDTAWDGLCVQAAQANCGGTGTCPDSDHDCFTTGGPGCTDTECCDIVCALDPFCCNTAWDGLCVNGALANCEVPKCDFACDEGATDEGEPCGTDTNGGCNSAPPVFGSISCGETICGNTWAEGGTRDTDWYAISFDVPTEITLSLSGQSALLFGVVNTSDCATATAVDPFAITGLCGSGTVTACLPAGTSWIFVAPTVFEGIPCGGDNNAYQISIACGGECEVPVVCPNPEHDCFTTGTPGCSDEDCCLTVCAADPFCCDTAWDGLCVTGAVNLCGGGPTCPDSDHDCFTTGGPGCTDTECCDLVCAADPFCCQTAWDGLCVQGANQLCGGGGGDCPKSDHDCFTTGGPGCTDIECCEIVCGLDPFCCDTAWDGLCVTAALNNCGGKSSCPDSDHDCFTTGGPGCTDTECCDIVCAADPFCCNTAWDGLCVTGAINLCGGSAPVNDSCGNASAIGLGATAFSTIGATTDGPGLPASCEEGFGLALVNDVWFNFVATQNGVLTVSACNTATYDTRLAAYEGAACFGGLVGCNDDGAGCGLTSLMTFNTTAGVTYKIRVGGFSGSGTGTLNLSY